VNAPCVFQPASDVRYAVEANGIRLIDTRSGATHILTYPQAAVWDMATRGCDLAQIIAVVQVIARVTSAHAGQIVRGTFESLRERGLVIRISDDE
jgi:hypothetical protein